MNYTKIPFLLPGGGGWGGRGGGVQESPRTGYDEYSDLSYQGLYPGPGPCHFWWQIVQIIPHSAEKSALFIMSAFFFI